MAVQMLFARGACMDGSVCQFNQMPFVFWGSLPLSQRHLPAALLGALGYQPSDEPRWPTDVLEHVSEPDARSCARPAH